MNRIARYHRSSYFLACLLGLSLLFGMLAPSISHILNRQEAAILAAVCSTNSTNNQLTQQLGEKSPALHINQHACGYCMLQAELPFISFPPSVFSFTLAALPVLFPHQAERPLRQFLKRSNHLSRAPPAL